MGKFLEQVSSKLRECGFIRKQEAEPKTVTITDNGHENLSPDLIRKHIIFYGRVQEVGFRYYSVYKARLLGLTGWVRNLYNGSVEMEVQGEEAVIEQLILFLQKQPSVSIEKMEIEMIPISKERNFCERG